MYKQPEGKVVKVDGWYPKEAALDAIEDGRARWARENPGQGDPASAGV